MEQVFNGNCGFFNSINSDRTYDADDMNKPYRRIVGEGVFASQYGTTSSDFHVEASGGLTIRCQKGEGIVGGKWLEMTEDTTISVTRGGTLPRIDSILLRVDKNPSKRSGGIVYVEGTNASRPSHVELTNDDNITEYRIADIMVKAGASTIIQSDITDFRGSSECPWIASLIKQVDTSTLYDQWNKAYSDYYDTETERFNQFLETLTTQLNVSMSLIKYDNSVITSEDDTTVIPIGISSYEPNLDVLEVCINGLSVKNEKDYTLDGEGNIILNLPLAKEQVVDFSVLKSAVVGDATTVMQAINQINEDLIPLKLSTYLIDDAYASHGNCDKYFYRNVIYTANQWVNAPENEAFTEAMLVVHGSTLGVNRFVCKDEFTTLTKPPRKYERSYTSNGGWSEWVRVY